MNYSSQLHELYDFWFDSSTQKYWFNQDDSFDAKIIVKYSNLLQQYKEIEQHLMLTDENMNDVKQVVGYVVLLDQIPRHIYRRVDKTEIDMYMNYCIHFITESGVLSKIKCSYYSHYDLCFLLLPFRHSNTYDNFLMVTNIMWESIINGVDPVSASIHGRFLKATYERFDNHPFFISDSLISENIPNGLKSDDLLFNPQPKTKYNIISISGGVDSMVMAYHLIKNTIDHDEYKNKYVAVHINYANREECKQEQQMVEQFCAEVLHIPCYIAVIDEIKRDRCMEYGFRDIYETYTKKVRFNAYRFAINDINSNNINKEATIPNENFGVYMGHNKDDCFENILTNIAGRNHFDNLFGMSDDLTIDGIRFIRPMLDVQKSDIYTFAEQHKIPHVKDSTPSWSQRGQIRDIVRPTLNKWNPQIVDGMFYLSQYLKDTSSIIKQYASSLITKNDDHIVIKNENGNGNGNGISKMIWTEIFHQLNIHVSIRTLTTFTEKLDHILDTKNIDKYLQRKHHGHKLYYTLNSTTKVLLDIFSDHIMIHF